MKRNPNIQGLPASYLFPEINRRKQQYLAQNPSAQLISLGIGDTTEPIPQTIVDGLIQGAEKLATRSGYTGYGPEQGIASLREAIATILYSGRVEANEVFVSDGSKCDIGRLMLLFGSQASIAVQNPTYPVYADSPAMMGMNQIVYLPSSPETGFFPDLERIPQTDLIAICSPNNPTGVAATRGQLENLVRFARKNRSIILFDAAYAAYIQDPDLPRSIYEIEGAEEVAIELGSFSKIAGFTGVRLGWTVVPQELSFDDGSPVARDWLRVMTTIFNGASNIAQQGGLAILTEQGLNAIRELVTYYMSQAARLKQVLHSQGYAVYGGENAPYLWVHFPGRKSWDVFEQLLEEKQIISTPGIGFGSYGEGFLRFTAFGSKAHVETAIERLKAF